jgi:hypothetical protein
MIITCIRPGAVCEFRTFREAEHELWNVAPHRALIRKRELVLKATIADPRGAFVVLLPGEY